MQQHKFAVGQVVHSAGRELVSPFGRRIAMVKSGEYRVVRHMPAISTGPQYRIQSVLDGHERVVIESDLRL